MSAPVETISSSRPPLDEWSDLGLSDVHQTMLKEAAITPAVVARMGLSSVTALDALPAEFTAYGSSAVPALLIPWRSPSGLIVPQLRPDTPVVGADGRARKYLWPRGQGLVLTEIIAHPQAGTVVIVEGTKQALALASYAPDVSVYGMVGCYGWSNDGAPIEDLCVVDGTEVIVALDADLRTNLEVYTAAVGLAEACEFYGADGIRYLITPGSSHAGLDDVLARMPVAKRGAGVARLIERAAKKLPSRPRSAGKKVPSSTVIDTTVDDGRPLVVINEDRHRVINELTQALHARWDADRLFSYGQVLAMRREHSMTAVSKDAFNDLVAETARTMARSFDRDGGELFLYQWPDSQSMSAVLSRADHFSPLDKISRSPYVRPDGTICQTPGYDATTRTFLVCDQALEAIDIPERPTAEQLEAARALLMDDWLGDIAFHEDADQANALALVLTPLIRGLVPLAPLAVVDGLTAGVGKNLFADCVSILTTGTVAQPMQYTRDDEETRKQITAAFRAGTDVFVFDEAHVLEGASLARALTAITYTDRILGVSNMAEFPNRVTWMSLGNQVQVNGDMARRVYRVSIRPTTADPQDRDQNQFRHPDLREWTRVNRASLLAAALTVIRSWFVAGQPAPRRGVSFGSFEGWERTVGGMADHAGQHGFLDNLKKWRSESDFNRAYWLAHLSWLRRSFGSSDFIVSEAVERMRNDPHAEHPPGMEDTTAKGYARVLGQAYAKQKDRELDGLRLTKLGTGHNNTNKWCVISDQDPRRVDPKDVDAATIELILHGETDSEGASEGVRPAVESSGIDVLALNSRQPVEGASEGVRPAVESSGIDVLALNSRQPVEGASEGVRPAVESSGIDVLALNSRQPVEGASEGVRPAVESSGTTAIGMISRDGFEPTSIPVRPAVESPGTPEIGMISRDGFGPGNGRQDDAPSCPSSSENALEIHGGAGGNGVTPYLHVRENSNSQTCNQVITGDENVCAHIEQVGPTPVTPGPPQDQSTGDSATLAALSAVSDDSDTPVTPDSLQDSDAMGDEQSAFPADAVRSQLRDPAAFDRAVAGDQMAWFAAMLRPTPPPPCVACGSQHVYREPARFGLSCPVCFPEELTA